MMDWPGTAWTFVGTNSIFSSADKQFKIQYLIYFYRSNSSKRQYTVMIIMTMNE